MLTGQKGQEEKRNHQKVAVGYDLGSVASQISYCPLGCPLGCPLDGGDAVTVSCITGTEQYNIPTILCKKKGVNQWFYGREAVKFSAGEEGVLIEDLLTLAERGEDVMADGEAFDPVALLTLFVKRSFSLLSSHVEADRIEAVMFTVERLTPRMVDVLLKVAGGLNLKAKHLFFQSYAESFYYYILYQPKELWVHQVLAFDYTRGMKAVSLKCNKKTTPRVVLISERDYPEIQRMEWKGTNEEIREQKRMLDEDFLAVVERELKGELVSAVYLLGDGFKENWANESLRFLCRGRRVFQGNNLYSRGACFGALERLSPSETGKSHVYLGEDKLKANIGMSVLRRGEESYYAVLDAGTNWYEAACDFEMILESGNTLSFMITPLTGEGIQEKSIVLEGLPERPKRTTRLKIHAEMSSSDMLTVTAEDLGFGELFPSSGKGWTQSIALWG